MAVVIGSGVDGLRAAATLASTGTAVLFLQESESEHGLAHPDMASGVGRMWIDPSARSAAEAVIGPLVDAPQPRRWIARNNKLHPLPLAPLAVPGLFDQDKLRGVGRRFVERRLRNGLIPLTGEGQEERTYKEWVVRRMGEPAFEHLYNDYARRRWGLEGDALSVAVARAHHNPHFGESPVVEGGGPKSAIDHAVAVIKANGGEIRTGANVRSFKVEEGRVVSVRVGRRNVDVDGPLWVARTPSVIAGWLGDELVSGSRVDAGLLKTHDRVQVAYDVDQTMEADEVHLLDEEDTAFRVTQTYGECRSIVFHSTVSPFDPDPDVEELARRAHRLGWSSVDPATARVERMHEWVPLWAPVVHPRLRRLSLAFRSFGVVTVGRRGAFAAVDPGTELMLAARYAGDSDPDQREALRELLAPPVKDNDLNASFRDFIWR
jgi:hypothetical protein